MTEPPSFLRRVTAALRLDSRQLARVLGVRPKELLEIEELDAHELSDLPVDPLWTGISAEVDKQIGELMAIREELSRKMARDMQRRMARRMRISHR